LSGYLVWLLKHTPNAYALLVRQLRNSEHQLREFSVSFNVGNAKSYSLRNPDFEYHHWGNCFCWPAHARHSFFRFPSLFYSSLLPPPSHEQLTSFEQYSNKKKSTMLAGQSSLLGLLFEVFIRATGLV
jgi:hypothetical protein